ncbi:YciE/YciF ferroxidase family protein [Tellurirhabdus bombi]|uniref:YciE/YciF ferroxidase family protein n=1 Tax=Tellurirhabdus bombi TaxID=2907205 RepID=UPI001F1E15F8|nr:ferritin-like domain-containing protein [Tellurirhabdus bombi]
MASFTDQLAKFFGMNETDTSLRELFISELKGIYYAEKQFADAQPQMAEAATTDVVRDAFQQHRAETENQIRRLEQIFQSIGVEVDEKTCDAADGLVDDGQQVIADTDSGSLTRDAGLIIAGQKVEHHEIASYGSLHSLARLLGYHDAARLLDETLQEEKNTDKKLTEIAESFINERAKLESGDDNMHSEVRDRVNEGDYGNTSSRTGVVGTGTESTEYAGTINSADFGRSANVGTSRATDADTDYGTNSTSNTGYGTGQTSSGSYADQDSYSNNPNTGSSNSRIGRVSGADDVDSDDLNPRKDTNSPGHTSW